MWITTNEAISWLDDAVMIPNQNIGILAQVDKTRDEIFDKVKTAYTRLPESIRIEDWRIRHKPTTKYSTKKELEFQENHSKIAVITDSRWWTWSKLHISEFAFINNAAELLAWTLPSVPKNWDIIIESTANWFGNEFEMLWHKYYGKDSYEWSCIFLWWWLMPEYSLPLFKDEVINLPPELQHLNKPMIDGTILTEGQKKRYLNMYNSQTNPDYAFQEYPSTPEEAFLNTWTPVFKAQDIKALITPQYEEDPVIAWLRIYRPPTEECVYGWDTAEWVDGWDNWVIVVRDRETAKLLACFYGVCEPGYLVDVVDRLIELWYRWRIGVEKNNTWYAFYQCVKERDVEWKALLYRTNTIETVYDHATNNLWWQTNSKTRPVLMRDYKQAIKEKLILEQDERIKAEMFTFIYNDKMKEVAAEKCHDDGIMADSICWQMRKHPVW